MSGFQRGTVSHEAENTAREAGIVLIRFRTNHYFCKTAIALCLKTGRVIRNDNIEWVTKQLAQYQLPVVFTIWFESMYDVERYELLKVEEQTRCSSVE